MATPLQEQSEDVAPNSVIKALPMPEPLTIEDEVHGSRQGETTQPKKESLASPNENDDVVNKGLVRATVPGLSPLGANLSSSGNNAAGSGSRQQAVAAYKATVV